MTMFQCVAIAALALSAFPSWADEQGPDFGTFMASIQDVKLACGKVSSECQSPEFAFGTLFKNSKARPEVKALLPKLRAIAESQAEMWADTILEGEYVASSRERLDQVEAVYRSGNLIAYRIVYSASAWRVDGTGKREAKGRITEASIISKALESWVRDEDAFASFKLDDATIQ